MPYPAVSSRRMAYDIDGTVVGRRGDATPGSGIASWIDSTMCGNLNSLGIGPQQFIGKTGNVFWFFFPEKREIEAAMIILHATKKSYYGSVSAIQGSNDTTNGIDGTWENATFPNGAPGNGVSADISVPLDLWRNGVKPVSFSTSYKVIRMIFTLAVENYYVRNIHLYGKKASTETPDDIIILDNELATPAEFTAVKDWGDRPEGTTVINSIRIQNASSTKTANNINLQLNHADFLISFDSAGSWGTVLDILSLAPGAVSSPIYIKNQLGPPLLTLGPKAARLITAVGSWT